MRIHPRCIAGRVTMVSQQPPAQPVLRSVLRKQVVAAPHVDTQTTAAEAPAVERENVQADGPCILLDDSSWEMRPRPAAEMLSASNGDFTVVGVLGAQGLGKSALLNCLLGFDDAVLPAAGPHPTPAFPVARLHGGLPPLDHCTRGILLGLSSDRTLGLDTQPLFSASVLEEMTGGSWEQPPPALAAPAVAGASDAKAPAVPFEGVQVLAQLQLAVLLLATCHRVVVLCEGLEDYRTWQLVLTAEMLARGVPDPSLAPKDAQPAGAAAAGPGAGGATSSSSSLAAATAAVQQAQQPHQQVAARARAAAAGAAAAEHLAEVVLVHVLRAPSSSSGSSSSACGGGGGGGGGGSGWPPSAAQLEQLEARLAAFFASSRLCQPRPLRMRDHLPGHAYTEGSSSSSSYAGMSYWVLPGSSTPSSECDGSSSSSSSTGVWGLAAALLARPAPPFARRCSELGWLQGFVGEAWRAVRRSPDIAAFYSRVARTQLKGAGGWALAR